MKISEFGGIHKTVLTDKRGAKIDGLLPESGAANKKVETVIGDSQYVATGNYLACHDRGIQAHMAFWEQSQTGTGRREGIFLKGLFIYDDDKYLHRVPNETASWLKNRNAPLL